MTKRPLPPIRDVTWRLWVAYLGTPYVGWQKQPGLPSIESALQEAFLQLTSMSPELVAAGRTDSGVHAQGQVVSCRFESRFDSHKLRLALSSALPRQISVWKADEMPHGFHAKRQSIGKRYLYRIHPGPTSSPFSWETSWHIRQPLDLQAMQEAAAFFIGEHDFESFRSANCQAAHARRYIWQVELSIDKNLIVVDIRGNAFCHNMVRIMVGTLVDVGYGKIKPHDVKSILEAKDRTLAGKTAPPHGLTLDTIYYPDDLTSSNIPKDAKFPRYPVTKDTLPW